MGTSWKKWDSKGKKRKLLLSGVQTIHDQSPANNVCGCGHWLSCLHTRPWNNLDPRKVLRRVSEPFLLCPWFILVLNQTANKSQNRLNTGPWFILVLKQNANKSWNRLNTGLCFLEDLCRCLRCLRTSSTFCLTLRGSNWYGSGPNSLKCFT